MYEFRARIVADTAISQFERGLADRFGMDHGNLHIDRLSLHMQAVLGGASAGPHQDRIILRRTKAGDDMNLAVTSKLLLHQIDMLNHTHIHRADFTGMMAAEDMIHFVECV